MAMTADFSSNFDALTGLEMSEKNLERDEKLKPTNYKACAL